MEERLLYIFNGIDDKAIVVFILLYYIQLYVGVYVYDNYKEAIREKRRAMIERGKEECRRWKVKYIILGCGNGITMVI